MKGLPASVGCLGITARWSAASRALAVAVVAAALALVAGCGSLPSSPGEPGAPIAAQRLPGADAASGRFVIAALELDTWNAVGQILVRLDGVAYQGRSQMLGLYDVRYRGEPLLILTRGRPIRRPGDRAATEVDALRHDGQPSDSAAAVELLGRLQQQLPAEVTRIAAGRR